MYNVEHINCKVCGMDDAQILGIRGNREYVGADKRNEPSEHMVTNVVRCKRCRFVYTNPLIITRTEAYSDPEVYLPSGKFGPQRLFDYNLNLLEKYAQRGRMLDVGCGKGEFVSLAKQRGWEVWGIEASKEFAGFASASHGLNISAGSLEDVGYPDGFFDAVTLNMVLEHIDKPKEFIAEINRVLKVKGLLFIEVPNMDSLALKVVALYFRLNGKAWSPLLSPLHYPFHCYGYNASSIRHLLNEHGFKIRRTVIRDSSLRGFRPDTGGSAFEKFGRNLFTRAAGLVGKGDVLIAIAQKEPIQ